MNVTSAKTQSAPRAAFMLRDLLAIICTLLLLTFLGAPAMKRMNDGSKSAVCMNNLKQLIAAWQMYADENDGRLVENYVGGGTVAAGDNPRNAPWAVGWLDWGTSPDNTNILYLRSVKYARFSPYLRTDRNVHKCPADIYLNAPQRARGWKERVRSYSMNLTMGNGNALIGPWDSIYIQARKVDELIYPSPAESSVIVDELPASMNDPGIFAPNTNRWVDLPGNLHNGAGTVSFADAHVEVHSWRGPLRRCPPWNTSPLTRFDSPGDPDLSWFSYHSQRKGPESR